MNYSVFDKITSFDKNRLTMQTALRAEKTAIKTAVVKKVMGKSFKMVCPCCNKKTVFGAMELDHIQAKQNGGADVKENTCYICPICHNLKSTLENLGLENSAEYKRIQNAEKKSVKKNVVLYTFFEYISRASKVLLNEHPRYTLRKVLEKIVKMFGLGLRTLKAFLKKFSNRFTMRKAEVNSLVIGLRV